MILFNKKKFRNFLATVMVVCVLIGILIGMGAMSLASRI